MSATNWQLVLLLISLVYAPETFGQCLSDGDDDAVANAPEMPVQLKEITNFSLDLFRGIFPYNTSQNFFFSPYSIWNALTLAYFGAKGETELQLQKVLGHTSKLSAMKKWKHLQYIYEVRQMNNSDYSFNLANKAYFHKSVNIRQCMKDLLEEIETLDFKQPEASAKTINDFVSLTTKGRIPEIVRPSDLMNSKMALVNAAFFKGTWLYQFKPSATKNELFYATPEDFFFVDMMHQKGNFRSGPSEELGAHILELPYTGQDISMIILLPPFISGEEGFNHMVSRLDGEVLHKAVEGMWRGQVEVSFPKFKLAEDVGDELIIALNTMGIKDLFDSNVANLTGFDSAGGLSVDKSIHKAFVEVSEEGTEAAAATALLQFRSSRPLEPEKFICNHPFLFVIFDNVTRNILFLGAYKTPKISKPSKV